MATWYWSADNLIWQVSIDHNMMLYIKKVQGKPGRHVCQPIIWRMAAILRDYTVVVAVVVRTRPRAMPLAMITTRKSIHGFLLVSYMGMGLRLAALRAAGAPLWSIDTCQIKSSADQYHVTISRAQVYSSSTLRILLQLTADQVMVFDGIVGSCQVKLLKTELGCAEAC